MTPILSSGELKPDQLHRYTLIAKDKIAAKTPKKSGSIKCPACGGKLQFRVAKSDDQSVGQCATDHCVKWS